MNDATKLTSAARKRVLAALENLRDFGYSLAFACIGAYRDVYEHADATETLDKTIAKCAEIAKEVRTIEAELTGTPAPEPDATPSVEEAAARTMTQEEFQNKVLEFHVKFLSRMLTVRDTFAIMLAAAEVGSIGWSDSTGPFAYRRADLMLKAREDGK